MPTHRPAPLNSSTTPERPRHRPWRRPDGAAPLLLLAVLAVLAVLVGGCSSASPDTPSSQASGDVKTGRVLIVAPARRALPIAMAGATLEGKRLDLATLRGRPVVLNVWGSWCAPCRKEAPELVKAESALRPRGVTFVGIDVRDDPTAARAFQRSFKVTYPSLVDDGQLLLALRGAASPSAVPTTLVLDSNGRVAARVSGATDATTLAGIVETVGGLSTTKP